LTEARVTPSSMEWQVLLHNKCPYLAGHMHTRFCARTKSCCNLWNSCNTVAIYGTSIP